MRVGIPAVCHQRRQLPFDLVELVDFAATVHDLAGIEPGYEQKFFSADDKRGHLRLIGSLKGRDGSVTIHQDADLFATVLADGESVRHELARGRKGWVQVARGSVRLNDSQLGPGDGVAVEGPTELELTGTSDTEVLLFDMG